jgi:hypothetical protein
MATGTRARYSVAESEVFVTVYATLIECLTWASGYRYVRRYVGYSRREAIRAFRADFTADYPNP